MKWATGQFGAGRAQQNPADTRPIGPERGPAATPRHSPRPIEYRVHSPTTFRQYTGTLFGSVVAVLALTATVTIPSVAHNPRNAAAAIPAAPASPTQHARATVTASSTITQATPTASRTHRMARKPVAPTSSTTAAPAPAAATTATTVSDCAVALAYLAAHAKPGFAHYCRTGALNIGVTDAVAFTCMPGIAYRCPYGGPEIIIADPACAISYENEASNSYWNFSSGGVILPGSVQDGRTWDPYGECP